MKDFIVKGILALMFVAGFYTVIFGQQAAQENVNSNLAFSFLVQPQITFNAVNDEDKTFREDPKVEQMYYIRRAILGMSATPSDKSTLYFALEGNYIGRNSDGKYENTEDASATPNIQDVQITYNLREEFNVTAGLFLLPFTRQNLVSPESILGVDYLDAFVDTALEGNTDNWRDTGLMASGHFALPYRMMLEYRAGIFQGRTREYSEAQMYNEHDVPRFTGRLQLDILDAEKGFLYKGFVNTGKVLGIGGGVDFQPTILDQGEANDDLHYLAWTVDIFLDYPIGLIGSNRFSIEGGYMNVTNKPETVDYGYLHSWSAYGQLGFVLSRTVQPIVKYYIIKPDSKEDLTKSHIIGGFNYYLYGTWACIKAEFAYPLSQNKNDPTEKYGSIALQGVLL